MKKFLIVTLILLISVIFVPPGFAFSKTPPEKTTQEKTSPEKEPAPESAPVDERVPATKQQVAKSKPGVSGFVGTVIMVDANLIDVWGKKAEVVFDASNPELRGYKTIGDVMVGDTVAVAYTKDGIMITKLKGMTKTKALEEKKAEKAKKASRKAAVTQISCSGKGPCTVTVDKREE